MELETIFDTALGINAPWFVSEVKFDPMTKRLDLRIDFTK